ncbi:MAG: hypothetical protein WDA17_01385 [Sphaerochaetaceae bacterium]|jgi:hypothetical protein
MSEKTQLNYILKSTDSLFDESHKERLFNQIEVHKYFINRNLPFIITWEEAAFSWLENVYLPLHYVINQWEVRHAFNGLSPAELFFRISDHWFYLLKEDEETSALYAAIDYASRYGKGLGRFIASLQIPKKVA